MTGRPAASAAAAVKKSLQPRDPEFALGLDLLPAGSEPAQAGWAAWWSAPTKTAMCRVDARGTSVARTRGPGQRKPLGISRQRRADLIAVGRQVVEQDLAAVGAAPAVEIPLLPRLTTEPAPDHPVAHPELGGEGGPRRGMAEGVGRVQHVAPAAESFGVGLAGQKIPDQRLA